MYEFTGRVCVELPLVAVFPQALAAQFFLDVYDLRAAVIVAFFVAVVATIEIFCRDVPDKTRVTPVTTETTDI